MCTSLGSSLGSVLIRLPKMGRKVVVGRIHKLTAAKVAALRVKGLYNDGGCLCFRIARGGSRGWVFRYTRKGRRHDMGLGPYPQHTLAEAREKAADLRRSLARGIDPLGARRTSRDASAQSATFDQSAAAYVAAHEASWRSARHGLEWKRTLERYVSPVLGRLPVNQLLRSTCSRFSCRYGERSR